MTKFEIGKRYSMTSICDSNCKWEYKVEKRTAKSIWIDGKRFGIKEYSGVELVYPLGKYSMCPVLKADKAA